MNDVEDFRETLQFVSSNSNDAVAAHIHGLEEQLKLCKPKDKPRTKCSNMGEPEHQKLDSGLEVWVDWIFKIGVITGMCFSVYKAEEQPLTNAFLMLMIAASRLGTTWEVNRLRKEIKGE